MSASLILFVSAKETPLEYASTRNHTEPPDIGTTRSTYQPAR